MSHGEDIKLMKETNVMEIVIKTQGTMKSKEKQGRSITVTAFIATLPLTSSPNHIPQSEQMAEKA